MMQRILKIAILIGLLLASCSAGANDLEWFTDFDKARKLAAEKEIPILADFTGSDWCGWCMKLKDEVFTKEDFQQYAKKNFVLFIADFPRMKKIPAEVSRQNRDLANKYGIQGFPTILILDEKGNVLAQTGYRRGGAKAYVEHLKGLLGQVEKAKK